MGSEYEKMLIKMAINQIMKCVVNHDFDSAAIMIKLCKYIAGDDFEVTIERTGDA